MKKIPYGKVITVGEIRDYFAIINNADFTDSITAGIFISIVAWASYQRKENETPYWRTLKANGELNPKYPEGIELQKKLLEKEGHTIIQKGRTHIRYYVKDYDQYVKNEKKVLQLLKRSGEMLVICLSLIFRDFNINQINSWTIVLFIAFFVMILYEIYWMRYFKSQKTMKDMYSRLLGIPVAGATLPVIAFLLLSIYGKNVFLLISVMILGIGHIGIHFNHKEEVNK